MENRTASELSRRSFNRSWSILLHRIAAAAAAFRTDPRGLLETLEDRTLLSASGVNHTDLVIYHPGDYLRPAITGAPSGLTPAQIRTAYGISAATFGSVTGDGTGQTIAIIDAYNAPNIATDLQTFDTTFSLASANLTIIGQTGTSTLPNTDPSGPGNSWALETSLDVEWAHAVAPGAKILLVEANSASDSDLYAAVNTARNYAGVSVVSMSWGGSESYGDVSTNSYFTTPTSHTGVTFIASSGDSGAYNPNTSSYAVEYPAASPNVLSVGGTTLNVSSAGNYLSESGWGNGTRSGLLGGSGGGISTVQTQPSYQTGVVTQSTSYRAVPDVSFDANPSSGVPVIDTWDSSSWIQVGGTSLAAPMWAGVIAIANQGRTIAGEAVLSGTQAMSALYTLPSADFHDITSGSNGYSATTGYDLVTGRGSPVVNALVAGLVANNTTPTPTPTPGTPTIGSFTVNPTSVTIGASVTLTASSVTQTNGTISGVAFYRTTNYTPGHLSTSDTLLGYGTASGGNYTLTTSTTGLTAGTYTYYGIAIGTGSLKSASASATLTVTAPTTPTPPTTGGPVIGSFTVNPTTVVSGTNALLNISGVTDASSTVSSVAIYRESNSTDGLQVGSDTFIGYASHASTYWGLNVSTPSYPAGNYTFYAVATDAAHLSSTPVSVSLIVTAPNPPTTTGPVVGGFGLSPRNVTAGTTVSCVAYNITDSTSTVSSVAIYLESNSTDSLQIGSDTFLGNATQNGYYWTLNVSTTGYAAGTYNFYAVATDAAQAASTPRSAILTVTVPTPPPTPTVPTIGSLTASPSSVQAGIPVVLSANNVSDASGTIYTVAFYSLPANSTSNLSSGGTLLGYGNQTGTTWTLNVDTTNAAAGTYSVYAVAFDTASHHSAPTYASIIVTAPATPVAPANDNFANATVLTGSSATVLGTNVGATKQAGEPNHARNSGGSSVWYTWTATTSGKVSLDTHGSNFDTLLAVYTGSSVSALTTVASNDDDYYNQTQTSALTFYAIAGTTYSIAVDGYNGATGNIKLTLAQTAAPANDAFANATAFTGTSATGSNVGTTYEAGENHPGSFGGASVWWTWTATTSGTFSLTTAGSSFDTLLSVFTGSSLSTATRIAYNDDAPGGATLTSALTFTAVAGTTYHFDVDGFNAATGNILLNLAQVTTNTR